MNVQTLSPVLPALIEGRVRARASGRAVLVSLSRRWEPLDPVALFTAGSTGDGRDCAFWQRPATGFALVGIGEAAVLCGTGPERFRQVAEAWHRLHSDAVVRRDDAASGPTLLGGFSFDPERVSTGLWDGFPDARLVLPRFLLTVESGGCWLTASLLVDRETEVEPAARELEVEWESLAEAASVVARDEPGSTECAEARQGEEWRDEVTRAVAAIRGGAMEKVVLARAVRLTADRPFEVPGALERLAAGYPGCYVFAFTSARDGKTFLGATPERLARLADGVLQVAALAGSAPRGGSVEEDERLGRELLASAKDRGEHDIVVRALREGLTGICTELDLPEAPALLSFANIHHLYTPMRGRLAPGRTLLDAVERLHPTPAVGGWPRETAKRFIREHEGLDRGWYAAPVGWLDSEGNGEFAVALRSALVEKGGAAATLFAGCGIVADSDSAQEYAESALKLRPMLAALSGSAR